MKVGFLGLGGMGAAMATRLVQAGLEVTVWNRSAAACEPLVALGAARAEEVGELFGLDVVISMLADDQAIRGVLLDSGALERARPGLIHLSMSTLSLDCVEALDQAHQRQGLAFVAAPVFGRTDVAEAGKLNIVVGGPEEAIEQVKALLEIMGQKTWFFGKDPRGAMAVKISGNFMIASAIESMGESVALVKRLGVEPGRFMELMSSTLFDAPVYRNNSAGTRANCRRWAATGPPPTRWVRAGGTTDSPKRTPATAASGAFRCAGSRRTATSPMAST